MSIYKKSFWNQRMKHLQSPVGKQHEQSAILTFSMTMPFQLADQRDVQIMKEFISLNPSFSVFHEQIISPF